MTKTIIKICVCLLCTALLIIPMFLGDEIYGLITPAVDGIAIGPAFIDGAKYDYSISSEYIHTDDMGRYVVLIKKHTNFWYDSYTLEKTYLTVIKESDTQSAVKFESGEYLPTDLLYCGEIEGVEYGKNVLVVE